MKTLIQIFVILFLFVSFNKSILAQSKTKTDSTFSIIDPVETMPEIIGGFKTIYNNIYYPKELADKRIKGKVFILVYIDKKGHVTKDSLWKGFNHICDSLALKVMKGIKFTPYKIRGKVGKSMVMVPIEFKKEVEINGEKIKLKVK